MAECRGSGGVWSWSGGRLLGNVDGSGCGSWSFAGVDPNGGGDIDGLDDLLGHREHNDIALGERSCGHEAGSEGEKDRVKGLHIFVIWGLIVSRDW